MFNIKVTAPERCQKSKSHGAIYSNTSINVLARNRTSDRHMGVTMGVSADV